MIEREFVVKNKLGLHARPASAFVRKAAEFKSQIMVNKEGLEINGKSIMGLMMLAAEHGARLTVKASGPDEKEAIEAFAQLFDQKFGEEDPK